ncbi:hypothetical protein [Leisingera sp. MMG026]|uniref:hypothetical protein n=1 Tax=Leisingera sp. MMG026 TaxID=2909982 RepID=UPI001F216593|nr:hypothetical protein [Leisingera sp. MMG026]MCF6432643.1 hypothetical protein [Leisingera sp. MMG026]
MTIAQQALQSAVRRRMARAVVIRDAKAYEALYGQLQGAMSNAWSDAMREGIAGALDRLRDLGPGKFTDQDGKMILRVLEGSVGAEAISAAMREPVINLTDALYRVGAEEVGKATGVSIAFMRPDLDALDILKSGNLYWIGNSWNVNTQNLMAQALEDYFTEGMTREELTARFAKDFGTLAERGQRYWEILADHTATKTREMGRVSGYERAGIARVQVRAHLDERTTRICRHMHGRIIDVPRLREQRDEYLEAVSRRNEPAAKAAWTMHGGDADLSNTPTSKLDRGTAGPPYHFRCRTITVAYFGSGDSDIDRWTRAAYDREPLGRKDIGTVIDRAKGARWPHTKVVRGHYRKHGGRLGRNTQADYSQAAVDLIRRGDRDVYLSMRQGVLNATFVRAKTITLASGKTRQGFEVTAVDMTENKITSHHWRAKIETTGDEVPAQKQPGRGIMKWLTQYWA